MLARSLLRPTATAARQTVRFASKRSSVNGKGALEGVYQTLFKSNVTYITTILAAVVVVEAVYGSTTSYIWESSNRGRLYHHIDWTKFKTDDDDEEEEDDE